MSEVSTETAIRFAQTKYCLEVISQLPDYQVIDIWNGEDMFHGYLNRTSLRSSFFNGTIFESYLGCKFNYVNIYCHKDRDWAELVIKHITGARPDRAYKFVVNDGDLYKKI